MIARDLIYLLSKCKPDDEIFFASEGQLMFQFIEESFCDVYSHTDWDTGEDLGFLFIDLDKSLDYYRANLKRSGKTCAVCGGVDGIQKTEG